MKRQPINVICLKTGDKFNDEYVLRLQSMVGRHLSLPHLFYCFTDKPIKGVVCMPPPCELAGWWGKVGFHRADLPIPKGIPTLYFDLDTIIVDSIDELAMYEADFAIIKQWKRISLQNKKGQAVPAYNSSVMRWSGVGIRNNLWEGFTMKIRRVYRGDQDWIALKNPDEKTFPPEWFQAYEKCGLDGPNPETKVVICNVHDNHTVRDVPWVKAHWR
jgi:hypothetical protein